GLLILHYSGALNEVTAAQSDLAAWRQPEELLWRILAEIILFNVEDARELHLSRPRAGILGIVHRFQLFALTFRVVIDDDPQRTKYSHRSRRTFVQVLANEVLQHLQFDDAIGFGSANCGAEVADRLGRIAAPPNAGERRHAGIVPAAHVALLHQLQQPALAQQRIGQVEPVELDLLRREDAQLLD